MAGDLPIDRPFSRIEALYFLRLSAAQKDVASISFFARRWCWSRHAVRAFLAEQGYSISSRSTPVSSGVLATASRQAKSAKNSNLASDPDSPSTGCDSSSRTIDMFPDGSRPDPEPRFSDEFLAGAWRQWCRTKKGGNYPNAAARRRALDKLYDLSGGDEALASRALEHAFHRNWMSYIYYPEFQQQQPQPKNYEYSEYDRHGDQQSRQAAYGANNARRLAELLDGNSG